VSYSGYCGRLGVIRELQFNRQKKKQQKKNNKKKKTKMAFKMMRVASIMCLFMLTAAGNDDSVFRQIYDTVAAATTGGTTLSGAEPQILLLELPGLTIRREDYSAPQWRSEGFARRSPDSLMSSLVDRVPTYSSVVFSDSGRRISSMWRQLLRSYVVKDNALVQRRIDRLQNDAKPAREKLRSMRNNLADSNVLGDAVKVAGERVERDIDDGVDFASLCMRENDGDVSRCANSMRFVRERAASDLFDWLTLRSDLTGAESAVIRASRGDLETRMVNALENFEQSLRVDVGAQAYGTQYQATRFVPSDWHTWWPLDPASYDSVLRVDAPEAYYEIGNCEFAPTILVEPAYGVVQLHPPEGSSPVWALSYTLHSSVDSTFVGTDFVRYTCPLEGCTVDAPCTWTIGVDGDVLQRDESAFVQVSFDQRSATSAAADSQFGQFHIDGKLGPRVTDGLASVSDAPERRISIASESSATYKFAFEIAKVRIERPWLDLTLLDIEELALKGVSRHAWSDGSPFFAQRRQFLFKLLPTAMIIARNVRIASSSLASHSQTLEAIASGGDSTASLQIGPFVAGAIDHQAAQDVDVNKATHYATSSYDAKTSTLSIDGPQIIGWLCAPLPAFPNIDESDLV
jgi:hypothetical protein